LRRCSTSHRQSTFALILFSLTYGLLMDSASI
jgi:hypothetical protein